MGGGVNAGGASDLSKSLSDSELDGEKWLSRSVSMMLGCLGCF